MVWSGQEAGSHPSKEDGGGEDEGDAKKERQPDVECEGAAFPRLAKGEEAKQR